MRLFLIFHFVFILTISYGQSEQLAQNYYDRGEFEKALLSYEELIKAQPYNFLYLQRVVECYQQLQQYDKAEAVLKSKIERINTPTLYIELGYNYQLQKDQVKANQQYEKAIFSINENVSNVYAVANGFEKKSLLDYALQSYDLAIKLNPQYRFNYQMGLIYGQQGKPDLMIEKFLDEAESNFQNLILVQNQLSRFMMEEANEGFQELLKKSLLLRAQKNQDIFWNEFLSWFFVQQKEYGKAFIQEKAIYKRNPESFSNIVNLAQLAIEEEDTTTATEILQFILANTQDLDLQIQAHAYLLEMKIANATEKEYPTLSAEIDQLLKQYGISPYTLSLQLLQAKFQAFQLKNSTLAKETLAVTLNLPLNKYQLAEAKMELADIVLLEEKFNQALLYYAQVEEELKNDTKGHEASLKVAKTSYFKTDFEWALTQLKVLKSSSTQLIANDALELYLLINDNTVADSTQTALKKFAKADFLLYQNNYVASQAIFEEILKSHKGEEIEDETLLKLGIIQEKINKPTQAIAYYQEIIDKHLESIYRDEAYYKLAEIYAKQGDNESAKKLYEKIIFNHQDSIFFVEARKKYRQLRGDTTL